MHSSRAPAHVSSHPTTNAPNDGINNLFSDLQEPYYTMSSPHDHPNNDRGLVHVPRVTPTQSAPAAAVSPDPQAPKADIQSYTVAWICALEEEYFAGTHMLDEELPRPRSMATNTGDDNNYCFGRVGGHYVVVASLPKGKMGISSASVVIKDMSRSFPSLKFALMVGIGGGAPLKRIQDIRLGDVVVGAPSGTLGGVVQLEFGVRRQNGEFERRGHLNSPPSKLLNATMEVQRRLENKTMPYRIGDHMERMRDYPDYFTRPERDVLYISTYKHQEPPTDPTNDLDSDNEDDDECAHCDPAMAVKRRERNRARLMAHYGTIASDNVVMRDSILRDQQAKDHKVLCFEMEAAGLVDNLPCLVIRGISDYADSHKNDRWRKYATLVAAAYGRELLFVLAPEDVGLMPTMPPWVETVHNQLNEIKEHTGDIKSRLEEDKEDKLVAKVDQELKDLRDNITPRTDETSSGSVYAHAEGEHYTGTCNWLLKRDEFVQWTSDECTRSILWLTGKQGVGKTVLCTAAIKHLDTAMPTDSSSVRSSLAIIPHFLAKGYYSTELQLLGTMAVHLVEALKRLKLREVPKCLNQWVCFGREISRPEHLKSLIPVLLQELPLTYIFVDGLDEAEFPEGKKVPGNVEPVEQKVHIQMFVSFLIQHARNMPKKVRLWLSSQPLPYIEQYIRSKDQDNYLNVVNVDAKDTKKDIELYIKNKLEIGKQFDSSVTNDIIKLLMEFIAQWVISSDGEGSFIWAAAMVKEVNHADVEDLGDIREVLKTPPRKLRELYEIILQRVIKNELQHRPQGRHRRRWKWRDVLSLIAFAKRPLRMSEVKDAMAMLRDQTSLLTDDTIIRSCLGLVRYTPQPATQTQGGSGTDGIIRFTHSSVRQFLLEDDDLAMEAEAETMDSNEEDSKVRRLRREFLTKHRPFVTEDVIRTACLKYLAQPKYQKPLQLPATTSNLNSPSERGNFALVGRKPPSLLSRDAHFLLYSAKYWFQHCDTTCPDGSTDNGGFCDDPPKEVRQEVKKFISSSNFYTCIQVQSLFVQGHFLHSFDPVTGRGQSVRRTLPNWMTRLEPELLMQYHTFQGEWCRLLKGKTSDPIRGDLAGCFWAALGSSNFLSAFNGGGRNRYFNFCFDSPAWRRLDPTSVWQAHHVTKTQEGRLLLSTATLQARDPDKQYHNIVVEQWTLDGKSYPELLNTKTREIAISAIDTMLTRYTLPCNQSFTSISLLPEANAAEPPEGVAFLFDGSLIRVGPDVFNLAATDSKPEALPFPQTTNATKPLKKPMPKNTWEDASIRDCFTVVCRRRIYREPPRDHGHEERESRRVARLKQCMAANERSRSRSRSRLSSGRSRRSRAESPIKALSALFRNTKEPLPNILGRRHINNDSSESSSEYSSNSDSDNSADGLSESDDMDSLSSAVVSYSSDDEVSSPDDCSNDSETSETLSGSESDGDDSDAAVNDSDTVEGSDSGGDMVSGTTESSGYLNEEGSDEESHISDLITSLLIRKVSDNCSSESSSYNFEIDSDSEPAPDNDVRRAEPAPANKEPEAGSVSIGRPKGYYLCDACGERCYRERYNCVVCEEGRFDLCRRCERNGCWCFDQSHKLYRIAKEVVKGAVSRRKCNTRQELTAYRTHTTANTGELYTVLFRFRKNYPVLLYNSPPIIHQKHDLVIWPVTNTRLLFGDLKLQKYYEQKVKTPGSKNAHPICVDLSFSSCGQQLRMAVIDAVAEMPPKTKRSKKRKGKQAASDLPPKPRVCLNFHVLILQLSSTHPAMTEPKLVASTSCRLGCQDARSVVSTLPFAFNWTENYLYMTVSDVHLRVYRVRLSHGMPIASTGIQKPEGGPSATERPPSSTVNTTKGVSSSTCCGDNVSKIGRGIKDDAGVSKAPEKRETPAPTPSRSSQRTLPLQVQEPKVKVLLPRSARNRSVQYFPPPPSAPRSSPTPVNNTGGTSLGFCPLTTGGPSNLDKARESAPSTLAAKAGVLPSFLRSTSTSNGNISTTKSAPSSRPQSPSPLASSASTSHKRSHSHSRAHLAESHRQKRTKTLASETKPKATVIIGPSCHGISRNASPPIGVYLCEDDDLGGWIDVAVTKGITDGDSPAEAWSLEGQYYDMDGEPFEQSDCILIPFDF